MNLKWQITWICRRSENGLYLKFKAFLNTQNRRPSFLIFVDFSAANVVPVLRMYRRTFLKFNFGATDGHMNSIISFKKSSEVEYRLVFSPDLGTSN